MKRSRESRAAKDIPPDSKETLGRMAIALKRRKWTGEAILELINEMEYEPGRSTLFDWIAKKEAGLPVISPHKGAGRPPALTQEQQDILCGFFLLARKPLEKSNTKMQRPGFFALI